MCADASAVDRMIQRWADAARFVIVPVCETHSSFLANGFRSRGPAAFRADRAPGGARDTRWRLAAASRQDGDANGTLAGARRVRSAIWIR
jgi:hypothetical protein